ncbi:exopolysaccharide biosynthesis protein [Wolbachia endosymbiont of Pentidionis agamae]|uniref:exopolysaccharide biosynthesis protein n=1 Tax=Wolbachia endosymbiont of Pentidionis agamae TaxID=3110435 RepID=UPI002FD77C39
MQKSNKSASSLLEEVASINNADKVTLLEIKAALHEYGLYIFIILFSLPLSIPLPVPPGYTTIFSIPLLLFISQILLGFDSLWMPKWLEQKSFQHSTLVVILKKGSTILNKIEKFMKFRVAFIFCELGIRFLAFVMLISTFSIAIPLPFIHFIPAAGITFIALGMMGKDGLLAIVGVLISILGLFITITMLIFGPKLIFEFFSFLKNLI